MEDQEYDFLILGGDYNVVQEPNFYKSGGNIPKKKCLKILNTIRKEIDLIDIWREKNSGIKRYTWQQPSPDVKCRLDYFLILKRHQSDVENVDIFPVAIKSDHNLIFIKFKVLKKEIGPSYWKFNASLLQDESFCKSMESLIDQKWHEHSDIENVNVRYDLLKYEIQNFTSKFAKKQAQKRRDAENAYMNKLKHFQNILQYRNLLEFEKLEMDQAKFGLESLLEYKGRGSWIRSRVNVIEKDEKSNKYFFSSEKISHDKKTVKYVYRSDGSMLTNQKDLLGEIKNYYSNLYTSSYNDQPDFHILENLTGL